MGGKGACVCGLMPATMPRRCLLLPFPLVLYRTHASHVMHHCGALTDGFHIQLSDAFHERQAVPFDWLKLRGRKTDNIETG